MKLRFVVAALFLLVASAACTSSITPVAPVVREPGRGPVLNDAPPPAPKDTTTSAQQGGGTMGTGT